MKLSIRGSDMSTATVAVIKERSGRWVLVSHLPAGIDLTPMIHGRFDSEEKAVKSGAFDKAVAWTKRIMGVS